VGPLFGKLLARQFVEMWTVLGEPSGWSIVEQGAHGGEFAADVLGELQRVRTGMLIAYAMCSWSRSRLWLTGRLRT
jgi:SAM-dependent MidA family methyltransferase